MGISVETLAVSKKYTDDSLKGVGALAGKPCQIQSIASITGGNRVTFLWVDDNGDSHTSTMDVMNGAQGDPGDPGAPGAPGQDGSDGVGIKSLAINASNHLIVTLTNDNTVDAGEIPAVQSDWNQSNSEAADYIKNKPTLGTAAAKNSTDTVSQDNNGLVESGAVHSAIATALAAYTTTSDLTTLLAAKQDTLTFDNAPTENSNNPVKSGGVFSGEQNIYAVMGKNGAKNELFYDLASLTSANVDGTWASNVYTWNGVTFTINADKTISVETDENGATDTSTLFIFGSKTAASENNYVDEIICGCPSGGSDAGYKIAVQMFNTSTPSSTQSQPNDKGTGVTIPDYPYMRAYIRIGSGTVITTPVVFKPMICDANFTDADYAHYQPYAKTNQELTAENEALTNQVKDMNNVLGAKNILPFDLATIKAINTAGTWSGNAYTHNGVTFTPTFDSKGNLLYIDANGNATPYQALFYINSVTTGDSISLPNGNYIANGCPVGGANGTYKLDYAYQRSGVVIYNTDYGNGVEVALENDDKLHCYITIANNYTASHLKFYPMIRLASETDATYVPYAKTNQELTAENQTLSNNVIYNGSVNLMGGAFTGDTLSGVTWSVDSDNVVTISRAAETTGNVNITSDTFSLKKGSYVLSGNPTAISGVRIGLLVGGNIYNDTITYDESIAFTLASDVTNAAIRIYVPTETGAFSNKKASVMITRPSSDVPYVPYAKTNKELTDSVATANTNIDKIKKGTLDIDAIELTANTPTKVISSYGVYLITFTHGGAAPGGLYLAQVHASDVNGMQVAVIKESTNRTVSFDKSVVNQLTVTATGNGRMRIIKLDASNY